MTAMALFTAERRQGYARSHMPQPATADGPWGEAIRYWLNERKLRQADLVPRTGLRANTISRATRGFHTTTRVLERIALALDAPLDAILVSPVRRLANEERRRIAVDVVDEALLKIETRATRSPYADLAAKIANRLSRLTPESLANYEAMLSDLEFYKDTPKTARPKSPQAATSKKTVRKRRVK